MVIADDAFIGINAVILPNVRGGRHAVVGAGAVVTHDVPDYCVAAGNPARVLRRYNFERRAWVLAAVEGGDDTSFQKDARHAERGTGDDNDQASERRAA